MLEVRLANQGHKRDFDLPVSPISVAQKNQYNGKMGDDMDFSRDSASIEINKMLDPKQSKGPSQNRINTHESPSSQMFVPDERSYKHPVRRDDSSKMRVANRDLDELLGLDSPDPANFAKKGEPLQVYNNPSGMVIPEENYGLHKIDGKDSMRPKMINQVPSEHMNDGQYASIAEENKRLKHALETIMKESADSKDNNPAVKIYMLQDQLATAEKTIKDLRVRNDELYGENEVASTQVDASQTGQNFTHRNRNFGSEARQQPAQAPTERA